MESQNHTEANFYPAHLMIKPESIEHFYDQVQGAIQTLEENLGLVRQYHIRKVLTPEEVDLIYPEGSIPEEFRKHLVENETEHYIFTGPDSIYDGVKDMKGKANNGMGIRGKLRELAEQQGLDLPRWQNWIHGSENLDETKGFCSHEIRGSNFCVHCIAQADCIKD